MSLPLNRTAFSAIDANFSSNSPYIKVTRTFLSFVSSSSHTCFCFPTLACSRTFAISSFLSSPTDVARFHATSSIDIPSLETRGFHIGCSYHVVQNESIDGEVLRFLASAASRSHLVSLLTSSPSIPHVPLSEITEEMLFFHSFDDERESESATRAPRLYPTSVTSSISIFSSNERNVSDIPSMEYVELVASEFIISVFVSPCPGRSIATHLCPSVAKDFAIGDQSLLSPINPWRKRTVFEDDAVSEGKYPSKLMSCVTPSFSTITLYCFTSTAAVAVVEGEK
mmetsp:Transcript_1209/g.4482  ORF Transcript_1209/g.4482 Transcript_1209/m.4482 type:complete len:283 (-) Transcript_1209:2040-2888(-)